MEEPLLHYRQSITQVSQKHFLNLKPKICLFFFLSLLCLSACTPKTQFTTPNSPALSSYQGKPKHAFGQRKMDLKTVDPRWWQTFHSTHLNQLIEQGKKHNYSLQAAKENLAQAKALVTATKSQYWPQTSLSAATVRQKYGVALFGPLPVNIPPFTYYAIGPNASYNLDVFGATRLSVEKQQALADYQDYKLKASYLDVTGSIATGVINIARLNSQLRVLKEIIHSDEESYSLVNKAFVLGSATQPQVLSVKTQLTQDKTLLPPLEQELKVAHSGLSILLGLPPARFNPGRFNLREFQLPKNLPLVVPSSLVHKRPDILASEAILHAAYMDFGLAKAKFYPQINITGSALQEALTLPGLFKSGATAWNFGIQLTNPLFTGGLLRAKKRAAFHAYEAAKANYQNIVLDAFKKVHDALYALENDEKAISLEKNALSVARKNLQLARLSFEVGNGTVLDILDAQRSYARARLAYVNVQARRYQDTISLYLALGGGIS